jgi:hypothetical protein
MLVHKQPFIRFGSERRGNVFGSLKKLVAAGKE